MSKNEELDLDTPLYQPADVAEVTGLTPKTIANWSDRGLGDPFGVGLGRGRSRLYSGRDLLRFALMRELVATGVSVVAGIKECNSCFGDAFSLGHLGYRELERDVHTDSTASAGGERFLANLEAVGARVKERPATLIVNIDEIVRRVTHAAAAIGRKKRKQ